MMLNTITRSQQFAIAGIYMTSLLLIVVSCAPANTEAVARLIPPSPTPQVRDTFGILSEGSLVDTPSDMRVSNAWRGMVQDDEVITFVGQPMSHPKYPIETGVISVKNLTNSSEGYYIEAPSFIKNLKIIGFETHKLLLSYSESEDDVIWFDLLTGEFDYDTWIYRFGIHNEGFLIDPGMGTPRGIEVTNAWRGMVNDDHVVVYAGNVDTLAVMRDEGGLIICRNASNPKKGCAVPAPNEHILDFRIMDYIGHQLLLSYGESENDVIWFDVSTGEFDADRLSDMMSAYPVPNEEYPVSSHSPSTVNGYPIEISTQE